MALISSPSPKECSWLQSHHAALLTPWADPFLVTETQNVQVRPPGSPLPRTPCRLLRAPPSPGWKTSRDGALPLLWATCASGRVLKMHMCTLTSRNVANSIVIFGLKLYFCLKLYSYRGIFTWRSQVPAWPKHSPSTPSQRWIPTPYPPLGPNTRIGRDSWKRHKQTKEGNTTGKATLLQQHLLHSATAAGTQTRVIHSFFVTEIRFSVISCSSAVSRVREVGGGRRHPRSKQQLCHRVRHTGGSTRHSSGCRNY